MPLIDFKEIPPANSANGEQDTFELFAREFLVAMGFKIVVNPDRGPDGGRDIIVVEKNIGLVSEEETSWLVSCKHKVHSGSSVGVKDEESILERVRAKKCDGFLGFYSTIISSGLNERFIGLKDDVKVTYFDAAIIERILLSEGKYNHIIKRYFPESFKEVRQKNPTNILTEYQPLMCDVCGKDLLHTDIVDKYKGNIIFEYDKNEDNQIVDVFYVCKGTCDRSLSKGKKTKWNDISDLIISKEYLKFIIGLLNRIVNDKDKFSEKAYNKTIEFIICISQIVLKEQSEKDIKRSKDLSEFDWI